VYFKQNLSQAEFKFETLKQKIKHDLS